MLPLAPHQDTVHVQEQATVIVLLGIMIPVQKLALLLMLPTTPHYIVMFPIALPSCGAVLMAPVYHPTIAVALRALQASTAANVPLAISTIPIAILVPNARMVAIAQVAFAHVLTTI